MTDLYPRLRGQVSHVFADTETTGITNDSYPVGFSYKTPDGKKDYLSWGHQGGGNNTDLENFVPWFRDTFGRPDGPEIIFHNAPFDVKMLGNVGCQIKAPIGDTQFMGAIHDELEDSFALDALSTKYAGISKSDEALNKWCASKFGGPPTRKGQAKNYWRAPATIVSEYAIGDVDMTEGVHNALMPRLVQLELLHIYEMEKQLIPLLYKMYEVGTRVDIPGAKRLREQLQQRHYELKKKWVATWGDVDYGNATQMGRVLDKLGIPYPLTAKTKKPSITKDYLIALDHPLGKDVREMKFIDHMIGTFIEGYVLKPVRDDGCIHPEFHPLKSDEFGTVSGRFSSSGEAKNLQNLPARDEEVAPMVRGMYIPYYEDGVWLKADYSQIEYRFFAHYAGGQILQAYIDNPLIDFHQMVADMAGIPRKRAKNVNFAKLYGAGIPKTALTAGVPEEEAAVWFAAYDERIPEAKRVAEKASRKAERTGLIRTWGGRLRRFAPNPDLGKEKISRRGNKYIDRNKRIGTHAALNALLQGSAADLLKQTMLKIAQIVDWDNIYLHLTVHDELDFTIPKGEIGTRFIKQVRELASDYPTIRAPIIMDAEVGPDWGHVEEIEFEEAA
jgi:DNA polymerase I-like protein with 3'-5' exonuclease and polymerase domains